MQDPFNPYAAPQAITDDVSENPQAEALRHEHLKHEASLKSVGALYYLSAVMLLIAGVAGLFGFDKPATNVVGNVAVLVIFIGLGAATLIVGRGLRKLKQWSRIPTVVMSGIGLLGFPVGTLLNGYILWLVLSKKGRFVLSSEYTDIIAATPHVKYRTPVLIWVFFGLIVLGVLAAIITPIMHK